MAVKTMNSADPSIKRPFRISDLQDIWTGLNHAIATQSAGDTFILCGFNVNGTTVTSGAIAFRGSIYIYDTGVENIPLNSNIYARQVNSGDMRVFSDGTTQEFSYNNVVSADSSGNAVLIGQLTVGNVMLWKRNAIPDGSISTAKLADNAVTTAKIGNGNVTNAKLGNQVVNNRTLADGEITYNKIADNAIIEAKIASNAVSSGKIKDSAITGPKIANTSVATQHLQSGSVTNQKIATNAISTEKIQDKSVTAAKLADGVIGSIAIEDGSVTESKIANYAVTTNKIADGAVLSGKLADGSVIASKIQVGSITSDKVQNNALTPQNMRTGTGAAMCFATWKIDFNYSTNPATVIISPPPAASNLSIFTNTNYIELNGQAGGVVITLKRDLYTAFVEGLYIVAPQRVSASDQGRIESWTFSPLAGGMNNTGTVLFNVFPTSAAGTRSVHLTLCFHKIPNNLMVLD